MASKKDSRRVSLAGMTTFYFFLAVYKNKEAKASERSENERKYSILSCSTKKFMNKIC
jgi:hypothetical protein